MYHFDVIILPANTLSFQWLLSMDKFQFNFENIEKVRGFLETLLLHK